MATEYTIVGDPTILDMYDLMEYAGRIGASANAGPKMQAYLQGLETYGPGQAQEIAEYLNTLNDPNSTSGFHIIQNADGTWTGYNYSSVAELSQTNPINSSVSTISRGNLRQYVGQKFTDVGGVLKRNMVTRPTSGGLGANAVYFLGSAASAWGAVSTGISLGKTIDSALYNANPDYWDSIGMETLNPETWNTIMNNDDSPFAGLFNFILGLDPDTGASQMYIPEDAYAYFAYALAYNDWFNNSTVLNPLPEGIDYNGLYPFTFYNNLIWSYTYSNGNHTREYRWNTGSAICSLWRSSSTSSTATYIIASSISISVSASEYSDNVFVNTITYTTSSEYTYDNKTVYFTSASFSINKTGLIFPTSSCNIGSYNTVGKAAWLSVYNTTESVDIDGVGNQPNATLPDTSTWNSIPNTLSSLQNQYPSTVGSPMVWDMYDDDGTPNQTKWVPVPVPDFVSETGQTPTSGNQTQSSTDVSQLNQTLQDLLAKILQLVEPTPQPEPSPEPSPEPDPGPSPNPPVPPNPDPTGDGETPEIPTVTGEASALWSVYNPTQAQVNSFGAWLWSSPFVTNILKLFQNPIEGVISLHKIFAAPVTGASANIVVGTLDSNVSSVTVIDQYTYVDCGSVDLYEQFGNVFDYSPFTEVSLYLPFIGIVTLDVADIMRSSIHISYGVDVYTGTCLAMVEVTRDACTVNMYQYSGVCSVEYPLSNVQNSQMLSGILSVAAGVATVATAGAAGAGVPALMGTAGGLAAMGKQHVGRSGGFSGNAGAMGIKKPYLIIQRPQTKVADTFPGLVGYPTNVSGVLNDFSGQVRVTDVHVEGIPATDSELIQIEELLKSGILI